MSSSSYALVVTLCFLFGLMSAISTFTMKTVYTDFPEFKSPACLLLGQSILNFSLGSILVLVKTANPQNFISFDRVGMRIPSLTEFIQKKKLMFAVAIMNFITIMFGSYSILNINIPMFLAFRRCAIFSTVVVLLFFGKANFETKPFVCTLIVCAGAIIAGWSSFEANWLGITLVWMNNIFQSLNNVFVEHVKKQNVSVFGKFSNQNNRPFRPNIFVWDFVLAPFDSVRLFEWRSGAFDFNIDE